MTETPLLKCFVLSPIGADNSEERAAADKVLKYVIRRALGDKYEVMRADDESNPGAITPQFVAAILSADLIVADITGHNPNVFYELAIAHGYNKPTVHIQKKGDKPPFDIKDMRIASYNTGDPEELEGAVELIARYAKFARENPEKLQTPLTAAERFSSVADSTDPVAESNVRVMEAIEELTLEVKRAIRPRVVTRQSEEGDTPDMRSVKKIVASAVKHDGLELKDLANSITSNTTGAYDNWVRKIALDIEPFPDGDLDEVLMTAELLENIARQLAEQDDPAPF